MKTVQLNEKLTTKNYEVSECRSAVFWYSNTLHILEADFTFNVTVFKFGKCFSELKFV